MTRRRTRPMYLLLASVGIAAMLAGLGILIVRHDEGQALTWLFIGAVIFGTSGIGGRRQRCLPAADPDRAAVR